MKFWKNIAEKVRRNSYGDPSISSNQAQEGRKKRRKKRKSLTFWGLKHA
jgi:hypothetical protein